MDKGFINLYSTDGNAAELTRHVTIRCSNGGDKALLRIGKWIRTRLETGDGGRSDEAGRLDRAERSYVVARSSVVATLILLFLGYLIGTTPSSPEDLPVPPPLEERVESGRDPEDGTDRNVGAEPDGEEASDSSEEMPKVAPIGFPLAGKTIVIDAGHGGADPGARGVSGRTRESYNTLFVAQDVQHLLKRAGAHVIMTRDSDVFVPLDTRAAIANKAGADIFISIHNDSNPDPSVRGVTTYYYTQQSRRLADVLQTSLSTGLGARNVGVLQQPFLVVRTTWMPSVLVELGFLTNWTDEQLLADPVYRYRAAEAIYKGVVQYFDGA